MSKASAIGPSKKSTTSDVFLITTKTGSFNSKFSVFITNYLYTSTSRFFMNAISKLSERNLLIFKVVLLKILQKYQLVTLLLMIIATSLISRPNLSPHLFTLLIEILASSTQMARRTLSAIHYRNQRSSRLLSIPGSPGKDLAQTQSENQLSGTLARCSPGIRTSG